MTDYAAAPARLDRYIIQRMEETGIPGLALALTDRDRTLRVATYGHADLASRTPVTPATLFAIGSVAKSFTSIAILRAREAGILDLHAPVARYRPWFAVRSSHAPITIHHLLTHTAGLIAGADLSPDPRFEVWALRETEVAGPPGAAYHYSNVGYKVLGLVLEAVHGRDYATIIREELLGPLGMAVSEPTITAALRGRLATGHVPYYDDRPPRRGDPLVPAPWIEALSGDGNAASTPEEMAVYLRLLINRGVGPQGRLLSEESFAALTRPVALMSAARGWHYGYGLYLYSRDGRRCCAHIGTMIGQYAALLADLDDGLGAMVMINGPGEPLPIAEYALDLLRAARQGAPLPPLPPAHDPTAIPNAAEYAGTYRTAAATLALVADGDRLILHHAGARIPLERRARDTFHAPHPDFARSLLRFGRDGGTVVEVGHGAAWYANDRYAGPTTFAIPDLWAAYAGHYRAHTPWLSNFRVVLRKDALLLILPEGREQPLLPLDDGTFRVGADARSPERIAFDAIIEGRALRARLSGAEYYRAGTID